MDSRPVSARRQATRDRLLDAAGEVFAERGFHGAAVEDICERAGFTRGAFYSNFASKDDLVVELAARQADALIARIRSAATQPDAAPEDVLRGVFAAIAEQGRNAQWLVLTTEFTLHAIRDRAARKAWAAHQRAIRSEVVAIVDEVVAEHGLQLPMSTDVFVRSAMALVQGSMTQRLIEPGSLRAGELEQTVVPLVLGLTT